MCFQTSANRKRCRSVAKKQPPTIKMKRENKGIKVNTEDSNVNDATNKSLSSADCLILINDRASAAATT